MTANPTQHAWSSEALFNKALLYVGQMEDYAPDDWRFGFWSSLSLELLARAAVAHVSPTLLADGRDWKNIHYALGHAATSKGYTPKSATIGDVLLILQTLLPEFAKELADFCFTHCARRNAELHSGENPFGGLGTSTWLPKFYTTCDVLLRSLGKSLSDFFEDVKTVEQMIAAMKDTAAKAVAKEIAAHKQTWEGMSKEEQTRAHEQAAAWATRNAGHRVDCPACSSPALLHGSPQGLVTTLTEDAEIVQKQTMMPSSFECIACGLKISGLSKLSACGLGDAFTATSTSSPADFFGLHTDEELEEARAEAAEPPFDDDFNEY